MRISRYTRYSLWNVGLAVSSILNFPLKHLFLFTWPASAFQRVRVTVLSVETLYIVLYRSRKKKENKKKNWSQDICYPRTRVLEQSRQHIQDDVTLRTPDGMKETLKTYSIRGVPSYVHSRTENKDSRHSHEGRLGRFRSPGSSIFLPRIALLSSLHRPSPTNVAIVSPVFLASPTTQPLLVPPSTPTPIQAFVTLM